MQDRLQALRLAECENTSLHAVFVCRGDEELKQEYLKAQMDVLAGNYDESSETSEQYETEEIEYFEESEETDG